MTVKQLCDFLRNNFHPEQDVVIKTIDNCYDIKEVLAYVPMWEKEEVAALIPEEN